MSLRTWNAAYAQITPLGDAYTNTAAATTNYGAKTLLDVDGATQITYIQFNLASIPSGANVSQATLKLYVNSVTTAGSFNVNYVNSAWTESTIDASNAPPLGEAIASNVDIITADKNQYILVDVTSAVQAWLSGSETNNGIALVANGTFNATFDSKENTTTSHPPELDLVFEYQSVNGTLSATGLVSASGFEIGGNLFDYGSYANGDAFMGFAGNTTMTGTNNTASGYQALGANTTGGANTASGYQALGANTTGTANTATGYQALFHATGNNNTATGALTLQAEYNTASGNTASGFGALYGTTTGGDNTASGVYALESNATGNYNTASGAYALQNNTTGNYNSATGALTLQALNNTASGNTASGYGALYSTTTGGYNLADGTYALYNNTTGAGNVAIGVDALLNNATGSSNVAIGYNAGTGANTNLNNTTAIGYYAQADISNAMVLGTTAAQNGVANILVGIDVSSPTNILTVLKGGGPAIADGWSTYSSRRWKFNIQPLADALSKVGQLRGVSYELKDSGKHEIGVIAEEVGKVVPEVVTYEDNGKDARGVDYSRLTALLIEAVKQQQKEIYALRTQLRARKTKEAALESRLERLEQDRGQTQLASARSAH